MSLIKIRLVIIINQRGEISNTKKREEKMNFKHKE